jgi:hypothetical protein
MRLLWCVTMLVGWAGAALGADDYRVDRAAAEQASHDVTVDRLYEDTYLGPPDGPQAPGVVTTSLALPNPAVDGAIYISPSLHFRLRVPRVAGQPRVVLRHSRPSRRPDGAAVTTHVSVETPGAYGVAALVVTRIRDDMPKDADSVLHQFEPREPAEYPAYAKQGVTFRRRSGPLGVALERVVRDRAMVPLFPFRTAIDTGRAAGSVGLSRYVVLDGFLCEFSLIVDGARARDEAALLALAESEMDTLMGGLLAPPN